MSDIKISIVDDHELFCDGLEIVLSQIPQFIIISKSHDGEAFLQQLEKEVPDIALMDISMPKLNGVETTIKALQKHPSIKVICLSSYENDIYYFQMIKAGASGFVAKKSGKQILEEAIQTVASGNTYFPPEIMRKIIFKIGNEEKIKDSSPLDSLSKREKEVLILICQGYSNKEIADQLFISPNTVENHRSSLLSKTGSKNVAQLVLFAVKQKIIDI